MEKDQIIILKNRGLISITGRDTKDFLQNIITNDINKVSRSNSIFAALLSPQGKYLYEFFVIEKNDEYLLDCDGSSTKELIKHLSKYKIGSKIEIKDISSNYVVGIISIKNFKIIQKEIGVNELTLDYRESSVFLDPRNDDLGARIISPLEKLYLTIKKLRLNIGNNETYIEKAFLKGIPIEGLNNLQNQIFGLELNFEKLNAIDFKKGCYIGQENTARMKLKNKLRRRLLPIKVEGKINIGSEIMFNNNKIGKVLINDPYPFGLIKLSEPDFSNFKNRHLTINGIKAKLILV